MWICAGKYIIAPKAKTSIAGQLPKVLDTHELRTLCSSAEVKLNKEQLKILDFLTEHVNSYGRYHIHKKSSKMNQSSKIGASNDLFNEVLEIWKIARAKLPGYAVI